jgi:hypothetical protein
MRGLLRKPWLHLLLLGSLLFVIDRGLELDEAVTPVTPIPISDALRQRLAEDWMRETGRAPDAAELAASVRRHIDDEILLREALRQDLHRRDPVVRQHLLANMRFVAPDSRLSDEVLLRQAYALGMHQQDLIARRRLVLRMRQQIAGEVHVDEAALRAYVDRHPERYGHPQRYRLRQVFIAADDRDAAERLLSRLRAGEVDPDTAGDVFLLGRDLPAATREELALRFGAAFARTAADAAEDWAGPVRSAYGWHLLRVEQVLPARPPDYATVRSRAAYAWLAEREIQVLEDALAALRPRYPLHEVDNS